jgi:hypothetical protein
LVVVGILQVAMFFIQLRYMRSGMDDAAMAANASKDAADTAKIQAEVARGTLLTMQDTAERQLRAYIIAKAIDADEVRINGSEDAVMVTVRIVIKNTGQTPAHNLKIASKTELVRHPIPLPFNFTLISGPDPSVSLLGAGESIESESRPNEPFDGNAMMVAKEPECGAQIYTWGTVTYRDVFGNDQWTNFCSSLIFRGDEILAHASEHHNDAS